MALKVFISYSSRDRPDALRLKEIAESAGHDVWMDLFDIHPAARLAGELEQGVSSADVLCLLLSPSAVASPWVRDELRYALAAEGNGLRVMPIVLRAAPIPEELADRVAVDATRGLWDDAVALRIRRALGGDVDEGVLLDAVRRGESADRALIDAAQEAMPRSREALDRVIGDQIRALRVTVDQDTWPERGGEVMQIKLAIDMFEGSLSILLAPYIEGHTWDPAAGIDERSPDDFFASAKPRVDARLFWAGRMLTPNIVIDATDLGELPLDFTFEFPGDDYTGEERAATMALLTRFELPSLRELIDRRSTVEVWLHPPGGAESRRVDPAATDLHLRLEVPLRRDKAGIFGFRLWGDHDRTDQALLRAPVLAECASDLEREALLSLYRSVPLRAQQNSADRRQRLAAAVASGSPVDEADRWAAFTMSVGRAPVPRRRGQLREAAEYVLAAFRLLGAVQPDDLDYPQAFRVLTALVQLTDDLSGAGGTREAIEFYSDAAVDLARRLAALHPDEPDYSRALARKLIRRAQLFADAPDAEPDVREAVATIDALAQQEPLPWRVEEAQSLRRDAEALLRERGTPALGSQQRRRGAESVPARSAVPGAGRSGP